MILVDHISLEGVVVLKVFKGGVLQDAIVEKNLIVNIARDALARLVVGAGADKHVTKIGFGTGSAPASPSDTELSEDALIKNIEGFSHPVSVTLPDTTELTGPGIAQIDFLLGAGDYNGKAVRELGLVSEDGSLFTHKVRAGVIDKESDMEIVGSWYLIF